MNIFNFKIKLIYFNILHNLYKKIKKIYIKINKNFEIPKIFTKKIYTT